MTSLIKKKEKEHSEYIDVNLERNMNHQHIIYYNGTNIYL